MLFRNILILNFYCIIDSKLCWHFKCDMFIQSFTTRQHLTIFLTTISWLRHSSQAAHCRLTDSQSQRSSGETPENFINKIGYFWLHLFFNARWQNEAVSLQNTFELRSRLKYYYFVLCSLPDILSGLTRKPCCRKETARCCCKCSFRSKFANNIPYKYKTSHASKATLQSSKHMLAQNTI